MASLPPQRRLSQQRRAAIVPPSSSTSPEQHQRDVERMDRLSQSLDSETVLLNTPPEQAASSVSDDQTTASQANTAQDEEEPRRCWICFNDETEDDETTSEWRSPCTCSLTAHEKCLLDWIADMEAPNNRRRAGTRASKIQCPQCKSEIKIARPRSYVVDAVRVGERLTGTLLLPGFALVTGTALWSTLTLAGTHTIYQVFGTEDALQILAPLYETPDVRLTSPVMRMLVHLQRHWRLDVGLPLIPSVLVASRTTWADSVLPFLPLIFFASSGQPGDDMMQLQWPPSAAFSFAALPYIRGFYNAFYDRICLPREQKWLKEIQPRAGEDADDAQGDHDHDRDHDHAHDHDHDHEVVEQVEIEVDFDIFGNWNNGGPAEAEGDAPEPAAQNNAPPIDAPPQDDDDDMPALVPAEAPGAAPAPNVPRQPPAQPRRQRVRHERNIAFSTASLADTILGALIFPSIAAAMGELLKFSLPKSWVTLPSSSPAMSWLGGWITSGGKVGSRSRPTGLLQTRWGRSLVGGCLFVGLKDAVLLYVRWKMAQNHRRRRILDHESKKKKDDRAGVAAS